MSKHQFERTADLPEFCGKCGGLERMSQHTPVTIWTCNNCGTELTDAESDSHECAPVTRTRPRLPLHLAADGVTIVRPHPQADSEFAKQQGYIVARVTFSTIDGKPSDESKAYAALIVKAVNNHQKLVDAVKQLLEAYAPNAERSAREGGEQCLHSSVRRARAVLAAVQADAD